MSESPSRVRTQLGAELRALRTMAGESQRDLAERIDLGQVAISRAEKATKLLTRVEVEQWLSAYRADDAVRARVLALTEAAHNETRSWTDLAPDSAGDLQGIAGGREQAASVVRNFQLAWVPGLLQTAEYARLLLPEVDPAGALDAAASVANRLERQRVLFDATAGRRFEFLIAESVLLWSPGDQVMPAQLDRIASLSTLANVEVRILPSRRHGAAAWHSFILIEPDGDDTAYVTTELVHGGQEISEPRKVADYEALWKRLWEASAQGADALALIRAAM